MSEQTKPPEPMLKLSLEFHEFKRGGFAICELKDGNSVLYAFAPNKTELIAQVTELINTCVIDSRVSDPPKIGPNITV